jgi:hypothetical protein
VTADTDTTPESSAPAAGQVPAGFQKPPQSPQERAARAMARGIAEPIAEMLSERLPAAIAAGLLSALAQAPSDRGMCWPCFERKTRWDAKYSDMLRFAFQRACEQAGVDQGSPAAAGIGWDQAIEFIPEPLRPDPGNPFGVDCERMPQTFEAVVMLAGTGHCALDGELLIRQQMQQQAQANTRAQSAPQPDATAAAPRKPFLVAHSGNVGAMAREAAAGIPANLPT